MKYERRFIAAFDFRLVVAMHNDANWLQDVADILADVHKDISQKPQFLGMGWRPNGFVLSTAHETGEDFYSICTQVAGVASRFLSLGLPVTGAVSSGELFEQRQGDVRVQFGPAATKVNDLVSLNTRPRVIFCKDLAISGLEQSIPTDDDGWRYLDVFDPAFLNDYWALHYGYQEVDELPKMDVAQTRTLIAQLEKEASSELRPSFSWLSNFLKRSRSLPQ